MGRGRFLIWLLFLSAGGLAGWPQAQVADTITAYEYYPDGLTKTLTYANGVVSHYEYYDNAWLRSLESRTAAGELVSRYEYDYDGNGNRTEMREWNATPARRAADPMWAAVPSITRYGYDRLDRLVWAEYHPANGAAPYRRVEYLYDLVGNRLREVALEHAPDGTALRTLKDRSFRYSRLHQLEAVTDALVPVRGTRYLYDAAGNTVARITSVIGPDGGIVPGTEQSRLVFDWDAASRLRRVRQLTPTPGGEPSEELLAEFRYDYRGRRIAADSRFVAFGSDPIPAETRLYVYDEEAVLAEYGFGPDGRTPYKSRQYLYGNELLAVELYAPPEAGKTTGDGRPATGLEPSTVNHRPTATGNPAPGERANSSVVNSWELRGQRLSGSSDVRVITEEDRFYGGSSHPADAAAYLPPPSAPSSLASSRFPSPVSRSAFDVGRSTFDVRPTSPATGLLFYHLDALGSTVNLTAADGAVAESYLYDAWGNYRELDVPVGTPGLTASTPGPLAGSPGLPAPGQLAFKTGSGAGGPGLRSSAETLVIDPDLDENGLYCWATYLAYLQGTFAPYPESFTSSPADSNRLTYTGHEFDPATGLYYFKARFYDPEIGRFLSEDPYLGDAATPPSLHRFLYAYSNPLRFTDPTGRSTIHYTDRQAIAGKPVSPASQWGAPSDLTISEAELHYDLRQIYGQKTKNLADQYQVVKEKIQEKQTKYLATLVLDDDDFDQAGNPRLEKIYGEFIAVTGKYANSIVDLKEKLSQAIRQGGRVVDISDLFSNAYECSTALTELTADRTATGLGPVGSIQRQASYIGQAGMAAEYTATKGAANLTAETAGWASLGLGAYRAGKISLELIQAARALPGEGNLIVKIGKLLKEQAPTKATTGPVNNIVGNEFDEYVAQTRLRGLDDAGLLGRQERLPTPDVPGRIYVQPDYTIYNSQGNVVFYADAKTGSSIGLDAQARGLVQWSKTTTSKTLIYYTPDGTTPISPELLRYAQQNGVRIRQVAVP